MNICQRVRGLVAAAALILLAPVSCAQINVQKTTGTNVLTAISQPVVFPPTALRLLDTDATHSLILAAGANLSANRTLTISSGDANRSVTFGTNFVTASSDATATLTFTVPESVGLTTPTAATAGDGVIVTRTGTQTLTNKTLTSPTITGGTITGAAISAGTTIGGLTAFLSNNSVVVGSSTTGGGGAGGNNISIGPNSLNDATSVGAGIYLGTNAGQYLVSSSDNNVVIGVNGLNGVGGFATPVTSADNGIYIGAGATSDAQGRTQQIVIGTGAVGEGSNSIVIGSSVTTTAHIFGALNSTSIQNTPIGSTTPNSGAFTTLSATTPVAVASGGTGAGTLTGLVKGNGTSAMTAVAAPSGAVVGTTDSQTLTNKTISGASNTLTVRLNADVTGNLPVANLDTGTNATSVTYWRGDGVWATPPGSGGTGDVSSNTTTSVDSEIALFSSTTGKIIKRATGTGLATVTSGVLGSVAAPTGAVVGTTDTQTLTNKTLTAPIISTISNTGTLTLPTSTDTLVGRATTDTLTNKTLTAPIISTISNTGTLTLPTSTDTLVGRATTDTLSNKTVDNSNTFDVKDTLFTLQDDGNATKQVRFNLAAISPVTVRTFVFPDITDTLVTETATQSLLNKTLSAPNLTNASGNFVNTGLKIDDTAGDHKLTLAVGNNLTANRTLKFNAVASDAVQPTFSIGGAGLSVSSDLSTPISLSGGGWTMSGIDNVAYTLPPNAGSQYGDGFIVSRTGTITLSNKTMDNTNTVDFKDTLFTLQDDGTASKKAQFQLSGISSSTTRTFTLPDVSDTLVTMGATQTLSNKTIDSTNTLGSPSGFLGVISGATFANGALTVRDTNASHTLALTPGSDLTANRTLTFTTGDASRTLTINGDATLTGTNTGDQTITLTGDVTGSGTGSFATTIANNAVTVAKMADVATGTILGRDTSGTGDPEVLTAIPSAVQNNITRFGTISSGIFGNGTLKVHDTDGSHTLAITPGSNLTADRILTITTGDAARTLTLNSNLTVNSSTAVTLAGGANWTLSGAAANTYTLPTGGAYGTGTLVTADGTATLSNKTLASPVISSIVNTGTLTLPTSTDTLVGRATTDTLTNKTLTAPTINGGTISSATITGSTFGGLSAFLTSGSVVIGDGTTGSGGGGNNVAIGSNVLNDGTAVASGVYLGTNAGQYLTTSSSSNVVIGVNGLNGVGGFATPVTSADNGVYIGTGATTDAQGRTQQIVIGTGAVGEGSNSIVIGSSVTTTAHIFGAMTATFGNATLKIKDTGGDHTLTLAAGNNLTADRTLNISVVASDVVQPTFSIGGAGLSVSSDLSTPITLSGGGWTMSGIDNVGYTLPPNAGSQYGDGFLVSRTGTITLSNKTISGASNTLTNIGNSSLTNSSVTIGSTSVSLGGTAATVAGLTLTSPTIATILNTGTLTLPTSTDTLVGRATTDTLTNKTLTSPTISGGTINNVVIGGTTSAAATFTTLTAGGRDMTPGYTWTSRTTSVNNDWRGVVYGNGQFVAVAGTTGTGNKVMTSPDGVTWTAQASAADDTWRDVTFGNGLFVAVSSSGTVMTSPDGRTWTTRTAAAANQWLSVTFGEGVFVATSITGSGNRVMTSPDGVNWTSRTSAANNEWYGVTYGNGQFVAVSSTGTGDRVMTSPDGVTWTSRTSAADNNWRDVVYANGLYVAVAQSGTGDRVMTSPDGVTWTSRTSPEDNWWRGIDYGDGLFVAVAQTGTNRVMTSPDGITWTARSIGTSMSVGAVAFGNGIFVAVADTASSNVAFTSGLVDSIADRSTSAGTINAPLTVPNAGLNVLDTNGTHTLGIVPGSNLTANRSLTVTTGDANRALTLNADLTVNASTSVTFAGGANWTLSGADANTYTLPPNSGSQYGDGFLVTRTGTITLSNKTFSAGTFTGTIDASAATLSTGTYTLASLRATSLSLPAYTSSGPGGGGDDPNETTYHAKVTTTDATVTTLRTVAVASGTTYQVRGTVTARRTGGASGAAGDSAGYTVDAVFVNEAGTVSLIGSSVTAVGESQPGWDVTWSVSGTNLLLRVTGAASNNVSWIGTLHQTILSN